MESVLKSLHGIRGITVSLVQGGIGEAEVVYVPADIGLEDLKEGITLASGEKHDFKVIAVKEEGIKGGLS